MCHRCVYTGSFELDYPRTLLAALHVHRIEIPYRAFAERFGPRILSLESVDYFGTTDHFSGRNKKSESAKLQGVLENQGRGWGIRDRGLVKKNLKIK